MKRYGLSNHVTHQGHRANSDEEVIALVKDSPDDWSIHEMTDNGTRTGFGFPRHVRDFL